MVLGAGVSALVAPLVTPHKATVLRAAADGDAAVVQEALINRRTVHNFDNDKAVPETVLRRAVECAIRAPNHRITEPWKFVSLGSEAVAAIAALNAASIADPGRAAAKAKRWAEIRHWLLVTSTITPGDALRSREDYAASCCAVQNLQLSLAADGVGTKWTSGAIQQNPDFARICGIDPSTEDVVGVVWYGYPAGAAAGPTSRKRGVDDVLSRIP